MRTTGATKPLASLPRSKRLPAKRLIASAHLQVTTKLRSYGRRRAKTRPSHRNLRPPPPVRGCEKTSIKKFNCKQILGALHPNSGYEWPPQKSVNPTFAVEQWQEG